LCLSSLTRLSPIHQVLFDLHWPVNSHVLDFVIVFIHSQLFILTQICKRIIIIYLRVLLRVQLNLLLNVRKRQINMCLDPWHAIQGFSIITLLVQKFIASSPIRCIQSTAKQKTLSKTFLHCWIICIRRRICSQLESR